MWVQCQPVSLYFREHFKLWRSQPWVCPCLLPPISKYSPIFYYLHLIDGLQIPAISWFLFLFLLFFFLNFILMSCDMLLFSWNSPVNLWNKEYIGLPWQRGDVPLVCIQCKKMITRFQVPLNKNMKVGSSAFLAFMSFTLRRCHTVYVRTAPARNPKNVIYITIDLGT